MFVDGACAAGDPFMANHAHSVFVSVKCGTRIGRAVVVLIFFALCEVCSPFLFIIKNICVTLFALELFYVLRRHLERLPSRFIGLLSVEIVLLSRFLRWFSSHLSFELKCV